MINFGKGFRLTAADGFPQVKEGVEKLGPVYVLCVLAALAASASSFYTIWLHLKNYRRPDLQRLSIRILLMIPVYAISTLVSLNSKHLSMPIGKLN